MPVRVKVTPRESEVVPRATRRKKTGTTTTWSPISSFSKRLNTESRMEGVDTPNFHQKVKSGVLIPHTPYFRYWARTDNRAYSHSYTLNTGYTYDIVRGSGSNTIVSEFEAPLFDQGYGITLLAGIDAGPFLRDAVSAVNNRGFDSLTFLAQLHKVRSMFKNILFRVLKLIRNPRDLDHISSLWLEGRYGWRTLRYDIIDLEQALTEFDEKRRRYTETRGTTITENSLTEDDYLTSAGTYTLRQDLTWTVGIRGCVTADIAPAKFRTNLPVTAWELVPFSFVIDWFYDVGSSLESMLFLNSVTSHSASAGFKVSAQRTETVLDLRPLASVTSWSFSRTEQESGEWIYRTPTGVSINPTMQVKLDGYKVLDILALIKQALAKRR